MAASLNAAHLSNSEVQRLLFSIRSLTRNISLDNTAICCRLNSHFHLSISSSYLMPYSSTSNVDAHIFFSEKKIYTYDAYCQLRLFCFSFLYANNSHARMRRLTLQNQTCARYSAVANRNHIGKQTVVCVSSHYRIPESHLRFSSPSVPFIYQSMLALYPESKAEGY